MLPLVAVFAFSFWLLLDLPRVAIGGVVAGAVSCSYVLFSTVWPTYIIVSPGREFPEDARAANLATQRYSRRLVTATIAVAVILGIVGLLVLRQFGVLPTGE